MLPGSPRPNFPPSGIRILQSGDVIRNPAGRIQMTPQPSPTSLRPSPLPFEVDRLFSRFRILPDPPACP